MMKYRASCHKALCDWEHISLAIALFQCRLRVSASNVETIAALRAYLFKVLLLDAMAS